MLNHSDIGRLSSRERVSIFCVFLGEFEVVDGAESSDQEGDHVEIRRIEIVEEVYGVMICE